MACGCYFSKLADFVRICSSASKKHRDAKGARTALAPFLDASKVLYAEEDVHRNTFRKRMKSFVGSVAFFSYPQEVRQAAMEGCPTSIMELVSE